MISYELLGIAICSAVCKVISDWTQPSPFLPYSDTLCSEIPFAIETFHYRMHFRGTQIPKYPTCAYHVKHNVKHSICINLNLKKNYLSEQETMCWYEMVLYHLQIHQCAARSVTAQSRFVRALRPQTCCHAVHTISVLLSTLISFTLPLYHLEH